MEVVDWLKSTTGSPFTNWFNQYFPIILGNLVNLNHCQRDSWDDARNRREFMDRLGKRFGFKNMKGWYKITQRAIEKNGGRGLLNKFSGSPSMLLRSVFPDHVWETHRFGTVPQGYWNDSENIHTFMRWLGKRIGVEEMKDWYKLTKEDVKKNGGWTLLGKFRDSPSLLVWSVFQEHHWDVCQFRKDLKMRPRVKADSDWNCRQ